MKRRWLAVAAVALCATAAVVWPRDDGLNWIRSYGGDETVTGYEFEEKYGAYVVHEFVFPKGVPVSLAGEIRKAKIIEPPPAGGLPGPGVTKVTLDDNKTVTAGRVTRYSWLQIQWDAVQRRIGLKKDSDPICIE